MTLLEMVSQMSPTQQAIFLEELCECLEIPIDVGEVYEDRFYFSDMSVSDLLHLLKNSGEETLQEALDRTKQRGGDWPF